MLPGADHLPTLATERLELRWLTPDDAPALLAVFGDPLVCRYWSRPPLPDLGAAAALQREIAELFAERSLFQWGVAERATGTVIGTGTLSALCAEHRRAEIGFALARGAWGRGYAREVAAALLAYAFDGLGLHRVEADVDPRNAPSIRTLEGAGFVREGCQRERYFVAGEIQDAVMYGLLRREWAARRAGR